ncbi:hypothetical protein LI014_02115 [Clostridium perfringens]|uniref:hypothetical protein n=1 Tax=Clostridium perfringens TaxID=1502 RepID=UPI001ABB1950|nr:hypothetical protein [Clostridium perfringens]MBO3398486.1 hypothetical protein [Clostridium perfringens]MCX0396180.1 hypothetical protein [Clostridium perfringens]
MVFTKMEIYILKNILDKNDMSVKSGLCKAKGTTVKQIVEKTKCSDRKVRLALNKFLEAGMIAKGIAQGRTQTYYLLQKGLEELQSLNVASYVRGGIENE